MCVCVFSVDYIIKTSVSIHCRTLGIWNELTGNDRNSHFLTACIRDKTWTKNTIKTEVFGSIQKEFLTKIKEKRNKKVSKVKEIYK